MSIVKHFSKPANGMRYETRSQSPSTSKGHLTKKAPQAHVSRGDKVVQEGQARITCPSQVVSCSIDTLHLTFAAEFSKELLEKLKEHKQAIQRTPTDTEKVFYFGETELFSFSLQRSGSKLYPYLSE